MTQNSTFFRTQAGLQRDAAADATLDNIRDRCERAAASWDMLAVRAERAEKGRTSVPPTAAAVAD
jgi:hypothetical protein